MITKSLLALILGLLNTLGEGFILQIPQNCTLKVRSRCGVPTECDADPPTPLAAGTVIELTEKVKWNGHNSWKFAIEDGNKKLTPLTSGCTTGQPSPAEYPKGTNLTLSIFCDQLPRALSKGDKLWIYVFSDMSNPDDWLMFNIAIPGITNDDSKQLDETKVEAKFQSMNDVYSLVPEKSSGGAYPKK